MWWGIVGSEAWPGDFKTDEVSGERMINMLYGSSIIEVM